MSARSERRFGMVHLRAEFLHSAACIKLFNQLQITVILTEYDNEKRDVAVGVASPQLPKIELGAVSPTYEVFLDLHTGNYEFVL